MIFLRHGSLNSDEKTWLSATEVFRRTGIKLSTQHKIIHRWRSRGYLIINNKRKGRMGVLKAE